MTMFNGTIKMDSKHFTSKMSKDNSRKKSLKQLILKCFTSSNIAKGLRRIGILKILQKGPNSYILCIQGSY